MQQVVLKGMRYGILIRFFSLPLAPFYTPAQCVAVMHLSVGLPTVIKNPKKEVEAFVL